MAVARALAARPAPCSSRSHYTILAGLLAVAGLLHIALLRDLVGGREWRAAVVVGIAGFATNPLVALAIGLALWWRAGRIRALRRRATATRPARTSRSLRDVELELSPRGEPDLTRAVRLAVSRRAEEAA